MHLSCRSGKYETKNTVGKKRRENTVKVYIETNGRLFERFYERKLTPRGASFF